jgi:hypothetical protein
MCGLGSHNFTFMTALTKEIVSTFPQVDGTFNNRWEGSGMCYRAKAALRMTASALKSGPGRTFDSEGLGSAR